VRLSDTRQRQKETKKSQGVGQVPRQERERVSGGEIERERGEY
jgi:hypothetical protein